MKILIFISLLLFPSFSAAQNVSGNVQDFHFNTRIEEVSVTLKDNSNGEILGTDSTDASGNYSIDYIIVGVNENNSIPDYYHLSNAYPNPFNPSTTISWRSPVGSHQTIKVFDVLGNEVATLVDEYKATGSYEVKFGIHSGEGQNLSSGIYFYQLKVSSFIETKKMMFLK